MSDDKTSTTIGKVEVFLAVVLFLAAFSIYLLPWFVPFIWDLPVGMTPPYYGILVAIEVSPLAQRWREAVGERDDEDDKRKE